MVSTSPVTLIRETSISTSEPRRATTSLPAGIKVNSIEVSEFTVEAILMASIEISPEA